MPSIKYIQITDLHFYEEKNKAILPSWDSPSLTDLCSSSPTRHGIGKKEFKSLDTQGAVN